MLKQRQDNLRDIIICLFLQFQLSLLMNKELMNGLWLKLFSIFLIIF